VSSDSESEPRDSWSVEAVVGAQAEDKVHVDTAVRENKEIWVHSYGLWVAET